MKSRFLFFSALFLGCLTLTFFECTPASGAPGSWGTRSSRGSHRPKKTLGIEFTLMGEPFPSAVGFNVTYQLLKPLRVQVGYGRSDGTGVAGLTMGGSVNLYMLPSKAISPFLKVGYAKVNGLSGGLALATPILSVNETPLGSFPSDKSSHFYYGGGIEISLSKRGVYFTSDYVMSSQSGVGGWVGFGIGTLF